MVQDAGRNIAMKTGVRTSDEIQQGKWDLDPKQDWIRRKKKYWYRVPHYVDATPETPGVFTGQTALNIHFGEDEEEGRFVLFTLKTKSYHEYLWPGSYEGKTNTGFLLKMYNITRDPIVSRNFLEVKSEELDELKRRIREEL